MTLLYKYVSIGAAKEILRNNSLGFTNPSSFNDPFDVPINPPVPAKAGELEIFDGFRGEVKSQIWNDSYGALSLTRSPNNALMWSHYADEHRGAVIGLDAELARFNSKETNFVPAYLGSVVYTKSPQTGRYKSKFQTVIRVGATHDFHVDHFEKVQRLFLTKPLDWAYEEEVRVVKCLEGKALGPFTNDSGSFTGIETGTKTTYCFQMPQGAIKSVYLGARASSADMKQIRALTSADVPVTQLELDRTIFGLRIPQAT